MLRRRHLFVAVASQFVHVPDRQAGVRQGRVPVAAGAVFDNEIFMGIPSPYGEVIASGPQLHLFAWCYSRDGGAPSSCVLLIGADLNRILGIGMAARTHETKLSDPIRLVAIVVEIGKIANHMSILMTERPKGEFIGHVGDLVVVGQFLRAQSHRLIEMVRVGPQPFRPVVHPLAGVSDIDRVDVVSAIGGELGKVEFFSHEVTQSLTNHFYRALRLSDALVRIVRAHVFRCVVGKDDIGVVEASV